MGETMPNIVALPTSLTALIRDIEERMPQGGAQRSPLFQEIETLIGLINDGALVPSQDFVADSVGAGDPEKFVQYVIINDPDEVCPECHRPY